MQMRGRRADNKTFLQKNNLLHVWMKIHISLRQNWLKMSAIISPCHNFSKGRSKVQKERLSSLLIGNIIFCCRIKNRNPSSVSECFVPRNQIVRYLDGATGDDNWQKQRRISESPEWLKTKLKYKIENHVGQNYVENNRGTVAYKANPNIHECWAVDVAIRGF